MLGRAVFACVLFMSCDTRSFGVYSSHIMSVWKTIITTRLLFVCFYLFVSIKNPSGFFPVCHLSLDETRNSPPPFYHEPLTFARENWAAFVRENWAAFVWENWAAFAWENCAAFVFENWAAFVTMPSSFRRHNFCADSTLGSVLEMQGNVGWTGV